MTLDELLKLEAGRELDAAIAVKLFGWEWWVEKTLRFGKQERFMGLFPPDDPKYARWNFSEAVFERTDRTYRRFSDWDRCGSINTDYSRGVPRYSTDIAAAFDMQDELERRGLQSEY